MFWSLLALSMAIAFGAGVMTDAILPDTDQCTAVPFETMLGDPDAPLDRPGSLTLVAQGPVETLDEALGTVDPPIATSDASRLAR